MARKITRKKKNNNTLVIILIILAMFLLWNFGKLSTLSVQGLQEQEIQGLQEQEIQGLQEQEIQGLQEINGACLLSLINCVDFIDKIDCEEVGGIFLGRNSLCSDYGF